MADGALEEQFPQPIAAAEEAQVAPGQAAPATQPGPAQPAQNEAQNAELEVNYLSNVFGFWLVHNLGLCFHGTLRSCLVLLRSFNHLEQNFSDVLLSFFMLFCCLLPRVQWEFFFSLVAGKCSIVVPNYIILLLSCGWMVFCCL